MTIHHDLTHAEYDGLPGWRWSHIKLLADGSPRAVQHALTAEDADTPSRVWFRAVHAAVLEPHRFDSMFVAYEGRRDKRTEAYRAFLEEHDGKSILTPGDIDSARATADAIRSHPVVRDLLAEGSPEVSVTWDDPLTGLPCKGRLDWLGRAGIVDLKTCGTVHERAVASLAARNLWHGQLAHYAAGIEANTGARLPCFVIAAEGKGAQDVAVYQLDRGIPDGALHVGAGVRSELLRKLKTCVDLNHWPGRHEGCVPLDLPSYAIPDVSGDITFGDNADEEGA